MTHNLIDNDRPTQQPQPRATGPKWTAIASLAVEAAHLAATILIPVLLHR